MDFKEVLIETVCNKWKYIGTTLLLVGAEAT
jgi:hypothetical protein